MLKKYFIILIIIILVIVSVGFAQETEKNIVKEIKICKSIVDREVVGVDSVFTADVGKVYCFTKIIDGISASTISHVWYYNDLEMAKVNLNVKSSSFRTWSSKKIYKKWVGDWRVDVVTSDGNVVKSIKFRIIPEKE